MTSSIYGTELMCASIVSRLRRSKRFLWTLIHVLTDVAINFRPFGPYHGPQGHSPHIFNQHHIKYRVAA